MPTNTIQLDAYERALVQAAADATVEALRKAGRLDTAMLAPVRIHRLERDDRGAIRAITGRVQPAIRQQRDLPAAIGCLVTRSPAARLVRR